MTDRVDSASGPAESAGDLMVHDHEREYAQFRAAVLEGAARRAGVQLFATTAGRGLFDRFLAAIPGERERQVHNCNACRGFFNRYGGLATVDRDGRVASAIWNPDDPAVPGFYRPAVAALAAQVAAARVRGVFYSDQELVGRPGEPGGFQHIHIRNPTPGRRGALTAGQAAAKKLQDWGAVRRAVEEFSDGVLAEAAALLEGDQLRGAHMYVAPLAWLREAKAAFAAPVRLGGGDIRTAEAALWARVAAAPEGFCHVRSGTLGGLLKDVAERKGFAEVRSNFNHKTDPRTHQRAQVAPAAGNIRRAEEIVRELGLAPSFPRRYASLEEVIAHATWTPAPPAAPAGGPAGGIFAHLVPKGAEPARAGLPGAPATTVTWEKLKRTALPGAAAVEAMVGGHGSYTALTAAEDPGAPPLFAWDREGLRNPFSWYTYTSAADLESRKWGLAPGAWAAVRAVVPFPYLWGDEPQAHRGPRELLVLEGCADQHSGVPLALFASILRRELHEVRATIEAHSKSGAISGSGDAQGLDVSAGRAIGLTLRVTGADGVQRLFHVDRWD